MPRTSKTPPYRSPAVEGIDAIVTGHSHLDFPGSKFDNMPGVDEQGGR